MPEDSILSRSFRRKEAKLFSQQSGYGSDEDYPESTYDAQTDDTKGRLGLNLLYSPPEPLIDFVFVHGLGGGSRKTWSKTGSISHYWPQEWLPKDHSFKNVRVLSFGYDSDWLGEKNNCFNIHHFAKLLLGELSTSPYLRESDTHIVFIAHSMGGLITKKAYLLARHDAFYDTLIKRFRAMCFFATPHLGSDLAKLLGKILGITHSSLAYVSDLKRGSEALQSINDEFRKYSDKIDLCSFYEMQKVKVGPLSVRIVHPESATLGFGEEQQIPLLADHRSICKFETPEDPNYILVRNKLESVVHKFSELVLNSKKSLLRGQIKDLEIYLGVSGNQEDDLIIVEESRIRGTCEWLRSKNSYMKWKDFDFDIPNVLWVNGKPATGKSVLAGYAISELRKSTANCSFHFFKYGDNSKSRLSGCLRSLVFQMACTNAQVREVLLRMRTDGVTLDNNDERILWRKLLLSGIFQNLQGHYWVIDGLDECLNVSSFFSSVLAKLDKSIRLRILVTSRDTPEIEKNFCNLGVNTFVSEMVSTTDTLLDIKALVEAKVKSLVVKDSSDRAVLVDKILKKSQGSFLWTVLVLNELSDSYTEQETSQVLEDVPRGMEPLYQRSLESMSQVTRGKKLSKAVLTWTTCATRPLKISELHGALKLDIQDNFPKLQESILALCGQLVTVDKFGRVQVLHETVREFLLRTDLKSEFAIIKEEAHTQIARTCLTYLTGNEMKPPRTARRGNADSAIVTRTEFSNYACMEFSYHLSKASPFANDVLLLVEKFLKSNILSWIEVIARSKDVTPLVRTAKNLKTYLNSCAVQRSPLGSEMQTVKGWTTDLIRIAAKFADALIISPSAIYSLIVPFCPRDSTVYKTVGTGRMLSVIGLSESQWDDRLACIEFHQGQTTAICYGDEFFAVGLSSGNVVLYQATSCQVHRFMDHGEAVKFLQISSKLNLIASCGLKMTRVWNIRNSQLVHTFQSPQRPIIMSLHTNLLIVASAKNYLASWDVENNGAQRPHWSWNDPDEMNVQSYRTPCAISISHGHQMLAVAYSGRPIMLWDLEEDAYYGSCGKKLPNGETSTHFVTALVFNPNPAIDRLVASYLDGDLVLIDPFKDQVLVSFRADCHILAASLDGRLLAGAAGSGTIQIYEFDTLTLLYRVQASDSYIKQLAFGHDGLHFADIRGSQLNIWQPTVLLRDLVSDDVSECTSTSVIEGVATDPKVKISAMVVHPNGEALFCGKDDGSVCIYDLKSGIQLQILYRHKSLVHTLTWWPQREILMSIDLSNKIQAWSLIKSSHGEWRAEVSFQSRLDCGNAITQVLSSDAAEKFILSTRETDHLWRITGQQEDMRSYSDRPGIRRWLQHQQSPLHVICFEGPVARIYAWSDWSEVISVDLKLDLIGMQVKNVIPYISETKKLVLLETLELEGAANTCGLYLLDASLFAIESKPLHEAEYTRADIENPADMVSQLIKGIEIGAVPEPLLRKKLNTLSHNVSHVIGLSATSGIVFLDTHSWVSSFSLHSCEDESQTVYLRHFFVPYDWFSGARHIISSITQRAILFAQNDDVVIIRGGLEDAQAVSVIACGSES